MSTSLRKFDVDCRGVGSPISDAQNVLLNHLHRVGSCDIGPLTEWTERLWSMLGSEGITVNPLEIALMIDSVRRDHESVASAAKAVAEVLREAFYS